MYRFWTRYIGPIVDQVRPARLLEVGAEHGANTRNILTYCRATGAKADIVDPAPGHGLSEALEPFSEAEYRYHALKGVDAIPRLDPPDVALIDGDHNWHTVYSELTLLFARAAEKHTPPPVVFLHDAAWPYARRDMYYDPRSLDPEHRQPYAYKGVLPGRSDLAEDGLNGHMANALHEGGPRNGVLTAVEDFTKSSSSPVDLYRLPFYNGLAILVPKARRTEALQALIDGFFTGEALLEAMEAVETSWMSVRVEVAQMQARLARRTDALARAREVIAAQAEEIARLRAQI